MLSRFSEHDDEKQEQEKDGTYYVGHEEEEVCRLIYLYLHAWF